MENGAVRARNRGVWEHLVWGPQPDFLGSQLRQEWGLKGSVSDLASLASSDPQLASAFHSWTHPSRTTRFERRPIDREQF